MKPSFVPAPGATVHIVNTFGTEHLHIVLAGPDGHNKIAIVSVSTDRDTKRTDRACFLEEGDHHFIRHRTYVFYAGATIREVATIMAGIDAGAMRLELPCTDELTKRVIKGALDSPRTPRDVRDFVRDSLINDPPANKF